MRPHAISWLTWGVATMAVFGAQFISGAGIGAWPTAISGGATLVVFATTVWLNGFDRATRTDWAFFVTALAGLVLWFLTSEPLLAVLIMSGVDVIGNGPTVRKILRDPFGESPSFFGLIGVRSALGVAALETYSATTVLFPTAVGTASALVAVLIVARRRLVTAG